VKEVIMGATTFFLLEKEKREKAEKEKKKAEVKTFKPDEKEIDYEEKVKRYHTGGGWYELPDVEKNVRKEEAIEILKESDK
jgi:hypothetical protein